VQAPSELAAKLTTSLETRMTQVADRVVTNALAEARSSLQKHDARRAVSLLNAAAAATEFSTSEVRREWEYLKKQAGKARLLARFGIRS
jgi:hypothetical protein